MQTKFKLTNNIQFLINRDNITQMAMSKAFGCTRQQISRWVHGEVPHVGYVLKMKLINGWDIEEIFEEVY
jgi:predicted XRE-type DNA-binding protein